VTKHFFVGMTKHRTSCAAIIHHLSTNKTIASLPNFSNIP
jgi:hypothetical protein